jgi:hypothetical protein
MNLQNPIRPVLNGKSPLNMREVGAILGLAPVTAARKVAANAEALRAFKTSGSNGQWRVRLADLRRVFGLPNFSPAPREGSVTQGQRSNGDAKERLAGENLKC